MLKYVIQNNILVIKIDLLHMSLTFHNAIIMKVMYMYKN
jgi:hypothetical protein